MTIDRMAKCKRACYRERAFSALFSRKCAGGQPLQLTILFKPHRIIAMIRNHQRARFVPASRTDANAFRAA
jgi:hypothetical protein